MSDATVNPMVSLGGRYVKPFVPGAGRFVDFIWPSPQNYVIGAAMSSRNSLNVAVTTTSTAFGTGGGNGVSGISGLPNVGLSSSAVVGNGNGYSWPGARVVLNTTKNALDASVNDIAVWRIIYVCSIFTPPAVTGECGAYLCIDPTITRLMGSASSGFGFRWLNDGSVVYSAIVAGAATNTLVLANAASEIFHSYEMRLYSATANAEARLEVYVDAIRKAIPATSCTWGAGTLLPGIAATLIGTGVGFTPAIVQMSNIVNGMRYNQVRVIAGPSLAACL